MVASPYGVSHEMSEYEVPDYPADQEFAEFAVPSGGAPYGDAGNGWTPTLEYSVDGTPDPTRLGRQAIHDARQPANKNPDSWWRRMFGANRRGRENAANVDQPQLPGREYQEYSNPSGRFSRNPRETPPMPDRLTAYNAPVSDYFQRTMNGRIPSRLNGTHFSMADHQRYPGEIYGMAPARQARSTYRLDVAPYGQQIVDVPETVDYTPDNIYVAPAYPYRPSTYRLGSDR